VNDSKRPRRSADAGVVDEPADRTESIFGFRKHALHVALGGNVGAQGDRPPAGAVDLGRDLERVQFIVCVNDRDFLTARGQKLCDSRSDAAAPARDDNYAAVSPNEFFATERSCANAA